MRRPRRTLATVLAAALLGGGIALATAAPASAHEELVSSYPQANTTINGSPDEITLSFSGELLIDMESAIIEVIAPEGQDIATDVPIVADTWVTQHLAPEPSEGVYTVSWRVVTSDGHPITGEYTYTVEPLPIDTTTPAPEVSVAEQAPTPSPTSTDTPGSAGAGELPGAEALLPILAVLSGVLLFGAAFVLVASRGRRRRDRADADRAARDDAARNSGGSPDGS
ncbi:copper resistance protein CopC [Microbacterium sp. LRZ72]|uniref:copper resistance CopC family protein n=1 Tax=Microbacterium sp. LRZ72 TaxID=2942481 RepID=UPI0029AC1B26|nr:copper resistance protein CopC [Microbacterium sp. LRZ72]MDX2377581.1 copper resistance protein CopC [Microbacterium sp. LRZ72]